MQTQGEKIKNLAKAKGLKQRAILTHIGWTVSGFSRKVNHGKGFDQKDLAEIAAFLGVKPEYLRDTSRPFNLGDTIPADAVAEKTTPITEATDPVKALMELAQNEMAHRKQVDAGHGFDVLAQEMARLADEMREMRAEFKRMRDEDAGEHDDDN